jgi:hypothetical protein
MYGGNDLMEQHLRVQKYGTFDYYKQTTWMNIKVNSRKYEKRDRPLSLTKDWYYTWFEKHRHKVEEILKKGSVPIVCRVNKNKQYSKNNIIITEIKNVHKKTKILLNEKCQDPKDFIAKKTGKVKL